MPDDGVGKYSAPAYGPPVTRPWIRNGSEVLVGADQEGVVGCQLGLVGVPFRGDLLTT